MATISKASVISINQTCILVSYTTEVAAILPDKSFIKLWGGHSMTTLKHINIFRDYNGLKKLTTAEWLALEVDAIAQY